MFSLEEGRTVPALVYVTFSGTVQVVTLKRVSYFAHTWRSPHLNNWITGVLQPRAGTRHHSLLPGSLSRYGGGGGWPVTQAGRGLHWYEAVATGSSQTEPYIASLTIFQVYNYCLYGLPAHLRKENTKLSKSAVSMEDKEGLTLLTVNSTVTRDQYEMEEWGSPIRGTIETLGNQGLKREGEKGCDIYRVKWRA